MKVAILQQDLVWANSKANVAAADAAIDRAGKADLYVLPEMFSTGFVMFPEGVAEVDGGETLAWMKRKAAQTGAALAGSLQVESNGQFYNRFYFVEPDGKVSSYNKRHLFAYGGENKNFTAGNERVIVHYGGLRWLLLVCYDLRFPVWSRCKADYDAMICVANWPVGRMDAWHTLLRARAMENQCYVVGVNRVGTSPDADYCGGSVVLNPLGKVEAACAEGKVDFATAELKANKVETYRNKFPAWMDADSFEVFAETEKG